MDQVNHVGFLLTVCVVVTLPQFSQSARILMIPFPFGSHVSQQVTIGENLLDRGHNTHLLISPTLPGLASVKKSRVSFIEYDAVDPDFYSMDQDDYFATIANTKVIEDFRISTDGFKEMCSNPLKDKKLFLKLKSLEFDLAIVDVFPCGRCMLVLMHRLGIPFINLVTGLEPWLLRNPSLPSVAPFVLGNNPYTERMTFWERLDNAWTLLDWTAFTGVLYIEDDFLREYFYETTPVPLNYLTGQCQLWLIDVDVIMDYPRTVMPNEVHIGGLITKPAKALPGDLEDFMSLGTEGVIVVSFGSMAANLPETILAKFLGAFRKINYKVIMRYPHNAPKNIPQRIKLLSWLPQNDLLGHPNTKLFITHCGANGGYEALYHGVPMIGTPVFAEQPYNAKRIVYHGYGLHLNLFTFQVDDLVEAIHEVISNKTYSDNIKLGSQVFHDRPLTPLERTMYWIEHILKYGGKHLHSHALEMPWYQYLMLDILAFVIGLFLAGLLTTLCVIRAIWRKFSQHQRKKAKTQ